jgi:hypothetical protein
MITILIHSPHMLVWATSEQFLSAGGIFRAILTSESHWLQPVLVLSFHWWAAPAGVGSVLANPNCAHSHFPHDFWSSCEFLELVAWAI